MSISKKPLKDFEYLALKSKDSGSLIMIAKQYGLDTNVSLDELWMSVLCRLYDFGDGDIQDENYPLIFTYFDGYAYVGFDERWYKIRHCACIFEYSITSNIFENIATFIVSHCNHQTNNKFYERHTFDFNTGIDSLDFNDGIIRWQVCTEDDIIRAKRQLILD